jgi:hypothetical protein
MLADFIMRGTATISGTSANIYQTARRNKPEDSLFILLRVAENETS